MKQQLCLLFSLWLLAPAAVLTAAPKKAKSATQTTTSAEAARVAILLYEDRTGTKNFEYMPGSLKEAITNSMHEKFEFNEVDSSKIEPVAQKSRAKSKGVIGPKEAAEICRQTDIDILIYGNFTFNKDANKIVINTNISLRSTDKFRSLSPVENPVDATIFQAADKVATDIVAEITKVAQEQQAAREKRAEDEKNKKTQLAKTDKRKTWTDINWNIALNAARIWPLLSSNTVEVQDDMATNLYGMYRFKGNWHVGLLATLANIRTFGKNSPYAGRIEYFASAVNAGYFIDLSARWRITTMLGLGYYFGKFSVSAQCPPNDICIAPNVIPGTAIRNPFYMARTGIHFLIFSFLAAGIEAEYRMLYDGKPIHGVGGGISLTFTF